MCKAKIIALGLILLAVVMVYVMPEDEIIEDMARGWD